MRFRFTILLLILNGLAFGLIFWLGGQVGNTADTGATLAALIGPSVVEADRIEIRGRGLETSRVLQRDGSTWTLVDPMRWSANYFAVNRILNQLQFLEEEAFFHMDEVGKTGQNLEDYGLADPVLTLRVSGAFDPLELQIGTVTEIGNNVYLLGPEKKRIFVVDREVVDSLLVDLGELRKREIFDIPVFEVEALNLRIQAGGGNGDLKVRLARNAERWVFESPVSAEADPALVTNAINTLTAAKVAAFKESGVPAPRGLDTPTMRVTLEGNQRRQTLLIGNPDSDAEGAATYFAKLEDNPSVFTVDARPFDELREAQEALRERNFFEFEPESLNTIVLSNNGNQIRLQKLETGEWQVLHSNGESPDIQPFRADAGVIAALIEDLRTLRASGFAVDAPTSTDLQRLGFNDPRREVALSFDGGRERRLHLAHPDGENEKLYARNDSSDFVYLVERRPTLRQLPLNALHYRQRRLDTLPEAARIQRLQLSNRETGEVVFEGSPPFTANEGSIANEPPGETPTAEGPEPGERELTETEVVSARLLAEAIRNFRVERYLRDTFVAEAFPVDEATERPWRWELEAEILLPGGETRQTTQRRYVFTERLSGTVQIGGSSTHELMFEIPLPLIEAMATFTGNFKPPPEASGALPEPVPAPEPLPTPAPKPTQDG